jgi:outer membrane beta-barrel protein
MRLRASLGRFGSLATLIIGFGFLTPRVALADDPPGGLGLDLSDDKDKKPADSTPTSKPVGPGTSTTPAPTDNPPTDVPPTDSGGKKNNVDVGEHNVSAEDRVKSIKKKPFDKKHAFELAPHLGMSLNDAFYQKYDLGLGAAFHISDPFAVGARFDYLFVQTTDNVATAKRELKSRLPVSKPKYDLAADFLWTPIYGKAGLFNSIIHFDLFVVTGAAMVWSQTSSNPGNPDPTLNQGPHPAFELGVGQRYGINELLAFEWQAIETLYPDTPGGAGPSQLQQLLTVDVGVSFFLPPLRNE